MDLALYGYNAKSNAYERVISVICAYMRVGLFIINITINPAQYKISHITFRVQNIIYNMIKKKTRNPKAKSRSGPQHPVALNPKPEALNPKP